MQEPLFISVELHAGCQQVVYVALGYEVEQPRIAHGRDHHPDADAAARGATQGLQQLDGGHEVGRCDADLAFGPQDHGEEGVEEQLPRSAASRPADLYCRAAGGGHRRGVGGEVVPACSAPVGLKEPLEVQGGLAFDGEMLVAPGSLLSAVQVVAGQVDAAQQGQPAVDDHHLAVVASHGRGGEPREADRGIGADVDSGLPQPFQKLRLETAGAEGVVDDPDLHAGPGPADQDVADRAPDPVVADDVVGDRDGAAGPLQGRD